jgi:polysaccharide biosynthesis/export protein
MDRPCSFTALKGAVIVALIALLLGCSSTGQGGEGTSVAALAAVGAGDDELRTVSELPAPPQTQGGVEQPISAADILEVAVFQVPDLSRTVQVDDGGRVSLPLIGAIDAAGKSTSTLQRDIEAAYGSRYLQSPSVSVFVKESAARRVTVDGEVTRAGVYPLPPGASLLDAVALAGGLRPVADPDKVYVFRTIDGQKLVANYSVDDIRSGGRSNPRLFGGDVVVVFASQSRVALQNLKEALGVASSAARLAVIP